MINTRKKILIYFLIAVLILVFVYLGFAFGKKSFPFSREKWQAVQLINGDVFYGKLRIFPCCRLTNVYFVQQVPTQEEGGQPGTQLMPLDSLFFGPENTMYLQRKNILWWANLSSDSPIYAAIKEQE